MLFFFPQDSRSNLYFLGFFLFSVSVRTECGIVVRGFNSVSSLEGGLRRVAKPKSPASTNFAQFPEIHSGSIPVCSENIVFQVFCVVLKC